LADDWLAGQYRAGQYRRAAEAIDAQVLADYPMPVTKVPDERVAAANLG
jgi:hypothetical protein